MAFKLLRLKVAIWNAPALKIILGAGSTSQPGWISTDVPLLDATDPLAWKRLFGDRRLECLLAEHVWEHFSEEQAALANANCFTWLKPGGNLRLAVPDGLHPDPAYIEHVRPGGNGPGADDHRVLHTHKTLVAQLESAGFRPRLLEYWDEAGDFHYTPWGSELGRVERSSRYDERNVNGQLAYTSLMVDATKP